MNEVIIASIIATLAITLGCLSAFSGPKTVGVTTYVVVDGDSVIVWTPQQYTTRLKGIDAPEMRQPYGPIAKIILEELLDEKELRVEFQGKDAYDRYLAILYAGDTNINVELVRRGAAFIYRKYTKYLPESLQKKFNKAEKEARNKGRGVWAAESLQERPWKHRRK